MIKIENISLSHPGYGPRGSVGHDVGLIYLNNRTLIQSKDYVVSFQYPDEVVASAYLKENQVIELIKSLELLLATKDYND